MATPQSNNEPLLHSLIVVTLVSCMYTCTRVMRKVTSCKDAPQNGFWVLLAPDKPLEELNFVILAVKTDGRRVPI